MKRSLRKEGTLLQEEGGNRGRGEVAAREGVTEVEERPLPGEGVTEVEERLLPEKASLRWRKTSARRGG